MPGSLKSHARKVFDRLAVSAATEYRVRALGHNLHLREDRGVRLLARVREAMAQSEELLAGPAQDDAAAGTSFLFWTMRGSIINVVIEAILGHALRLRGAKVTFVICDACLPACDCRNISWYQGNLITPQATAHFGDLCSFRVRSFLDAFRLPYVSMRTLLDDENYRQARESTAALSREEAYNLEHRGIPIGHSIRSSVIHLFRHLDPPADAATEGAVRDFAASAMLQVDAANAALERFQVTHLLTSHGLYTSWGPVTDVAAHQKIHWVVYGKGLGKSALRLSHEATWIDDMLNEPPENWATLELTPQRRERVEERIGRRWQADGSGFMMRNEGKDGLTLYRDAISDVDEAIRLLDLDPGKPTLGLFPNIAWDANIFSANVAFPDMIQWIMETVEFFAGRPEFQLVVRSHPMETMKAGATQQPVADEIARRFGELPPNVRVIPAKSPISSYVVARFAHAGVVHGSEFGLEMAYTGKPVIVTGGTQYRGKGFTYDVESRDDYLDLLGRFDQLPPLDSAQTELAKKYAYHFYFRREVPFKFIEGRGNFGFKDIHLNSLDELLPGKDEYLDYIISGLLDHHPFFVDPMVGDATEGVA
jgi:hypothetical protein